MVAKLGNPMANNNIIISKDFGLYMLYWQQSFMDDKLRARAGKMEFQAFFDRNAIAYDPVGGFLAQNFNQSSAIPFPDYGFAGIVAYDFDSNFTARIGVQNSMSSGITTGFDGMSAHNLFSILELDWRVWEPWGEDKREGHRRLMIWHTGIDDPFSAGGELSGWGVAFNMDQSISNDAAVFCRIGWGQEAVTPMRVAISGGFAVESVLPHVDMGVAGGWGEVTRLGRSDLADPSTPVGDQWLFEWYANMHVTPTLHMGPVVQVVLDKAADVDASIVYGWRASWAY